MNIGVRCVYNCVCFKLSPIEDWKVVVSRNPNSKTIKVECPCCGNRTSADILRWEEIN